MSAISELRAKFTATAEVFRATVNTVRNKIEELGPSTEKATKAANESFDNLQQSIQQMKDNMGDLGDDASQSMRSFADALDKVEQELQETGKVSVDGMRQLQQAAWAAQKDIRNIGDEAEQSFNKLYSALSQAGNGFDQMAEEAQQAKDNVENLENSTNKLNTTLNLTRVAAIAFRGVLAGMTTVAVPTVAVLTAGVGALASTFAAAGAGAVAFGAVAASAIGKVIEASEEVAKIEEKIAEADTAKERIAAQKELAAVYAGMSKEQQIALERLLWFKDFWNGFVQEFEKPVFGMFSTGLKIAYNLLNALKPTISNVAVVVNELATRLNAAIFTPETQAFFTWLSNSAGPALTSSMTSVGNILRGLMNLFVAFDPLATSMQNGMVNVTKSFADWTAGLSKSTSFQNFIEYAKTNGPVLLDTLKDIAVVIGSVVTALAPLGEIMLFVINQITGFVSSLVSSKTELAGFSPILSVIIPILSSLTAGFIAFKAVVGAQTLYNSVVAGFAAMRTALTGFYATLMANPIALTIAAIVAAITLLYFAWQNNWLGMRDTLSTVWNVIKSNLMAALGAVVAFVSTKLQELKMFWDQNGAQITQAASNAWNGIKAVISTVMAALGPVLSVAWTAIKVLVTSVWESIKGVISGALNVIQGAIKVFAGVFTGDWAKVWEGIKQATMGAVQFLWNAISLTFFGRALSAAKVFITGFKAVFTAGWTAIKSAFSTSVSFVQNVVTKGWNLIKSITNSIMNGIKTVIVSVWNGIKSVVTSVVNGVKSVVTTVWNGIKTVVTGAVNAVKTSVTNGFNALKTAVSTAMTNVKTTISDIWGKVMAFFRGIDLKSVGSDIIQGLIGGIMGKAGELYAKAKEIANKIETTIRNALDTHSPSRVTHAIGADVGEGLARGIESKNKRVTKAAEAQAKKVAAAAKKAFDSAMKTADYKLKMGEIDLSKYISSLRNIRATYAKTTEQVQKVNLAIKKAETDLAKKIDEINKQKFEASKKWIDDRRQYNELSLEQELAAWKRVASQYKKGTEQYAEAQREIYRVTKEMQQASFTNSKEWIDERKYYNELSLEEELAAWQRVQARYKAGTAERKEADKEVYRVRLELLTKAAEDEYKATIDSIEKRTKAAQEAAEREKESIESRRDAALDALKGEEQAELNSLERRMKEYERAHQERLRMADEETDRAVRAIQQQIDAIDRQAKDEDYAAKEADRNAQLAELQKQYEKYKVSASAKGQQKAADLLKQIGDLQAEIQREQLARQREQQKESLKQQMDDIKENAEQKKQQWQLEFDTQKEQFEQEKTQISEYYRQREESTKLFYENQLRDLEESTRRQLAQLEQQKIDAERTRDQMLEDAKRKAREMLNTVEQNQNQIVSTLQSKNREYYQSGQTLGNMFAYGLESAFDRVKQAANRIASAVQGPLKLNSPAKEGPLSTLDKWWNAFSDTLLEGLDTKAINAAMNAMVNPNLSFASLGAVGTKAVTAIGGGQIIVNVYQEKMFDGATFNNMDETDRRALAMDVGSITANQVQSKLRAGGKK